MTEDSSIARVKSRSPFFSFDAIRALMSEEEKPRKKIGFEVKEGQAVYDKEGMG